MLAKIKEVIEELEYTNEKISHELYEITESLSIYYHDILSVGRESR